MKEKSTSTHSHHGHRRRMTKNFMSSPQAQLTEIQYLEMLLFYCLPRADTNPIAHNLLEKFGSIENVLNANEEDIANVKGMGRISSCNLKQIAEFIDCYSNVSEKNAMCTELTHEKLCKTILYHVRDVMQLSNSNVAFILLCLDEDGELEHKCSFSKNVLSIPMSIVSDPHKTDRLWILCVLEQQLENNDKLSAEFKVLKNTPAYKNLNAVAYISSNMKITFEQI